MKTSVPVLKKGLEEGPASPDQENDAEEHHALYKGQQVVERRPGVTVARKLYRLVSVQEETQQRESTLQCAATRDTNRITHTR